MKRRNLEYSALECSKIDQGALKTESMLGMQVVIDKQKIQLWPICWQFIKPKREHILCWCMTLGRKSANSVQNVQELGMKKEQLLFSFGRRKEQIDWLRVIKINL